MKKNIIFLIIFFCCLVGVTASLLYTILDQTVWVPSIIAAAPTPPQNYLPERIAIPSIKVNANVESVGEDRLGNMDVPKITSDVAWFNLGPKPGDQGNAVIDGHVDTQTGAPAVFAKLKYLAPGDQIYITDSRNVTYVFTVQQVVSVPTNPFPTQQIFGGTKATDLNLITCSGVWDASTKNYNQRLVVYSRLDQ
jgi:LPXTG-site transpeptidase (sortase) family protein